ncbi:MAG TPA: glycosyltransferase family 1 protein [Thermoanaerobaculia bacterium]
MTTVVLDARKAADFGIGTYVRGLVGGFAELDCGLDFVLLGDPARAAGLGELPAGFRWLAERAANYSLRELWSVSRAALRAGADLFHAPHYVLPVGLRCPAVVTIHDLIHLRFPEHRSLAERIYAHVMLRRALGRAARVLAVSAATRAELEERFGGLAARVVTVSNGVDDRFRRPLAGGELGERLARFSLAPGYFLFVGNPKPHKNLDRLLAAHRRLAAARGAAVPALVVVGGDAAASAAVGVVRLGVVAEDDLPALYRGALALVVPSLWEGFGLPAAEAMACGTPVAAADRGALPEVIGDAGLLFPPDDVDAIAAALARLLDDAALRAELARRGPQRAERFRWRESARATLAVYREALAPSGALR